MVLHIIEGFVYGQRILCRRWFLICRGRSGVLDRRQPVYGMGPVVSSAHHPSTTADISILGVWRRYINVRRACSDYNCPTHSSSNRVNKAIAALAQRGRGVRDGLSSFHYADVRNRNISSESDCSDSEPRVVCAE